MDKMLARQTSLRSPQGESGGSLNRLAALPMDRRHRIGRLLDNPTSSWGATTIFGVLIVSIVLTIATFFLSLPPHPEWGATLSAIENAVAAVFTAELLLRTYVATTDLKKLLVLDPTW